MAGINLAGAVGMTGKRESIFSDLAPIVQHTGDAIAKSIQESKAKREKEGLLKLQQQQEDKNKEFGDLTQHISTSAKGLNNVNGFMDVANKEAQSYYNTYNNPKISPSEKQTAKAMAMAKISEASNFYEDFDKAIDALGEKSDVKNTLPAQQIFSGTSNMQTEQNVQENIPDDLSRKINPISTPSDSRLLPKEYKNITDPIINLPYEKAREVLGGKMPTQVVTENTYLRKFSPSDVATNLFGNNFGDSWVNELMVNGNTKFTQNKDKIAQDKNTYVYSVVNGTNAPAEAMKQAIQAELYQKSRETLMHLPNDERMKWIEDNTEKAAAEKFDDILNTKVASIENDPKRRFSTKQSGGSTPKIMSSPSYTNKEGLPSDRNNKAKNIENTAKELGLTIDPKQKTAKSYEQTLSNLNIIVNNKRSTDLEVTKAKKAISDINDLRKMDEIGMRHFVAAKDINVPAKKDYIDIFGLPRKGDIKRIEMYTDDKGVVHKGIIIGKEEDGVNVEHIIPFTSANKGSLQTDLGKNYDAVLDDLNKNIPKQNVSSQSKKEGVKAIKYEVNGKMYNIPETDVKDFLKDFPTAKKK